MHRTRGAGGVGAKSWHQGGVMTKAKVFAHKKAFCSLSPSLPHAFKGSSLFLVAQVQIFQPGVQGLPCAVYTGHTVNGASTLMCDLKGPLQCYLPSVPPDVPGPQWPHCLGLRRHTYGFLPCWLYSVWFPLPGMLSPPAYGNPAPHSSCKSFAQNAHSPPALPTL